MDEIIEALNAHYQTERLKEIMTYARRLIFYCRLTTFCKSSYGLVAMPLM